MACVTEAKRSFWALVNQWKAKKSATLTLKSVNGDLTVAFSVNLGQHDDKEPTYQKTCHPLKRGASSSKQRRQHRAADPAVRLRAEAHAAAQAAAEAGAEEAEVETLRSEKSHIKSPLALSPEKEAIREEVDEGEVEKPPLVEERAQVPQRQLLREHRALIEVPHDFADRANNDYEHDFEKTKEAEKLLSERDRCCFCHEYECPPPTPLENNDRILGILQSLWDHIELSHSQAFEWLT